MKRKFFITLESSGAGTDADGFQGFRRWLKACWRTFGLRAVDYSTDPPLPSIGGKPPQPPTPRPTSVDPVARPSDADAAGRRE